MRGDTWPRHIDPTSVLAVEPHQGPGAGGSGGSILITTSLLEGIGRISADGGWRHLTEEAEGLEWRLGLVNTKHRLFGGSTGSVESAVRS